MPTSRGSRALAMGIALAFAACADTPTLPDTSVAGPSASLLDGALRPLATRTVEVLRRSEPLPEDVEVTQVIGPAGGTIVLPAAGLTVRFPALAVASPTAITVTAPAGDLVGYHFAPHGLQFRRTVTVAQDLTRTQAAGLLRRLVDPGLSAAYFTGPLQPRVGALEILPVDILGALGIGVFGIDHFSGYVIATD